MNTAEYKKLKGVITIPLSERTYRFLSRLSFAKTRVPKGAHTDTHKHRFFSAYLVKNMHELWGNSEKTRLPANALVIVLPRVDHTWSNQRGQVEDCYVSDLSPAHGRHELFT